MNVKLVAIYLAIFSIQSCADHEIWEEPPTPPPTDECPVAVSYATQVAAIVNTKCAISGCHNGDNGQDKNWTVFSTFQQNAQDVKDRINRLPGTPGRMPAVGTLTSEQIQTITCWVDQGALNN
jgi:hypothetical protein